MDDRKKYLKKNTREVLENINTSLEAVYLGKKHMYRSISSQLRILFCDQNRRKNNSLLYLAFPNLCVSKLRPMNRSKYGSENIRIYQPQNGNAVIMEMPFRITVYGSGLTVGHLISDKSTFTPVEKFADEVITYYPRPLTVREVIKTIADKGGGAHVDAKGSPELRLLFQKTVTNATYGEIFIIALARLAVGIGAFLFEDFVPCNIPNDVYQTLTHEAILPLITAEEWADGLLDKYKT